MSHKLYCFDIIIENVDFLPTSINLLKNERFSLYFQLFSIFDVQLLKENFSLSDDYQSTNSEIISPSRMQIGKSCLFEYDHAKFVTDLHNEYLTLYLSRRENVNEVFAVSKISLTGAGRFFENEITNKEKHEENVQFAAGGIAKLINEINDECLAELKLAYRFWLINDNLSTFLQSHRLNDDVTIPKDQIRPLVPLVPDAAFNPLQNERKNAETQTVEKENSTSADLHKQGDNNFVNFENNNPKNYRVKYDKFADKDKRNNHVTIDSTSPISFFESLKSFDQGSLRKFPLLQELSLELNRIEKLRPGSTNLHTPTLTLKNIEQFAAEELRSKRHDRCKSAYANSNNKSFNLYSRLYSAKVPGYGLTKSFVQKMAYMPLYANYSVEPKVVSRFRPKKFLDEKLRIKIDEQIQVNDWDFQPKFKDISIMTVVEPIAVKSTVSTQTQAYEANSSKIRQKHFRHSLSRSPLANSRKIRRRKSSVFRNNRKSITPTNRLEEPTYSSDFSSDKESDSEFPGAGLIGSSSVSRRKKLSIPANLSSKKTADLSDSETRISENSDSNVSSATNSLLQTLNSLRTNLKTIISKEEKVSSDSTVKTAHSNKSLSVASGVLKTSSNRSRSANSSVVRTAEDSSVKMPSSDSSDGKISVKTVKPIPEGIERLAEKNFLAKVGKLDPPIRRLSSADKDGDVISSDDKMVEDRLSPVSRYLQEQRLKAGQKEKQMEMKKRHSIVRTESVSSYMPTDLDNFSSS